MKPSAEFYPIFSEENIAIASWGVPKAEREEVWISDHRVVVVVVAAALPPSSIEYIVFA